MSDPEHNEESRLNLLEFIKKSNYVKKPLPSAAWREGDVAEFKSASPHRETSKFPFMDRTGQVKQVLHSTMCYLHIIEFIL